MAIRFLTTSAAILLLAGPAFADCSQELDSLKQAVTEAETGASTAESGMPATKHQEQVLKGDQQGDKAASGDAAAGQAGVPASPHQEQVLADRAVGQADILVRLLPIRGSDVAANWAAHQLHELKRASATFGYQLDPAVVEFRDRLIEWQRRPSRTRKQFQNDLVRWRSQRQEPEQVAVA